MPNLLTTRILLPAALAAIGAASAHAAIDARADCAQRISLAPPTETWRAWNDGRFTERLTAGGSVSGQYFWQLTDYNTPSQYVTTHGYNLGPVGSIARSGRDKIAVQPGRYRIDISVYDQKDAASLCPIPAPGHYTLILQDHKAYNDALDALDALVHVAARIPFEPHEQVGANELQELAFVKSRLQEAIVLVHRLGLYDLQNTALQEIEKKLQSAWSELSAAPSSPARFRVEMDYAFDRGIHAQIGLKHYPDLFNVGIARP